MRSEYLFFAIFGLVVANLLIKVVRHGGFRGAMFGAPIHATIDEFDLSTAGAGRSRMRVHTLAGANSARQVGIELVHSTVGSWQMIPIALTAEQAHRLAAALERAATDAGRAPRAG